MKHLFYIVTLVSLCSAQQQLVVKTDNSTSTIPVQSRVQAVVDNTQVHISHETHSAETRWIVELTEPPLLQYKQRGIATMAQLAAKRSTILNAVRTIIPTAKIIREYSTVFNGFKIEAPRNSIAAIRNIPGVKTIHEDFIVSTEPIPSTLSNPIPLSPPTNTSGKGVRIGVIDTGIDYYHEAISDGFGKGHRVAGGYDFVNNDADPQDDHGHGTHVAGIIAGYSGTIKGIAYNAELYAYKVLNSQGRGYASDILAAIEQAISDSIDIINLSLGSPSGDPNDILSTAVDRAVEAGIVVVAAAGNDGEFESIHSPGVARNALTVGATDGKSIASFSSKGPVVNGYGIKPDVVAPGVGILSAKLGGGYIAMSGTSMATPIVTSIAAVLKEMHPGWNAFQIKDAIISNSIDLNNQMFAQGGGAVAEKIFSPNVIVSPAHISFGFNSPNEAQWIRTDTLRVFNAGTTVKQYTFEYVSTNPAVHISLQPSTVTIGPSEQKTIVVTITTNNLYLSNNKEFSAGYTGKIYGYSTEDTISVFFTFFKGNILHLSFNEVPLQVIVHNRRNFKKTLVPKTSSLALVVNSEPHDILTAFFESRYVVKESLSVVGFTPVVINSDEAIHKISIIPSDEQGKPLRYDSNATYSVIEGILFKPSGTAYVELGGGMMSTENKRVKYFSSMSSNYSYGMAMNVQYGTALSYTFEAVLDSGITRANDITFSDKPLRKVEVKFSVEPTVRRVFPITWLSFSGAASRVSVTFYNSNDTPLMPPFTQTNYYSQSNLKFPIFHKKEAYTF